MASPLVSFNIPAYNAGKWIKDALRSALAQTYAPVEVVVVDDGSTDETGEILKSAADSDSRVRVIRQGNQGVVAARNVALRESSGQLIAVLDQDDRSSSDRIERQVEYLAVHPECVAVGSRVLVMDADGDLIGRWFPFYCPDELDRRNMMPRHGSTLCHSSVLMRRESVIKVGGYREECATAEDLDLWLRLAEVGHLGMVDAELATYRIHPGSLGASNTEVQRNAAFNAISSARKRRGLAPVDLDALKSSLAITPIESQLQWMQQCGWMALSAGFPRAARKHARRALAKGPLLLANWRLIFCAIRGK